MINQITIDGTDISHLIAYQGIKWTRNDKASNVETMDGFTHHARIAGKVNLELSFRPLTTNQLQDLLRLIDSSTLQVEYNDPMAGHCIRTMYTETTPASFMVQRQAFDYWYDITITLLEC